MVCLESVISAPPTKELCEGQGGPHREQEKGRTTLLQNFGGSFFWFMMVCLLVCLLVHLVDNLLCCSCDGAGRLAESSRVTARLMGGVSPRLPVHARPFSQPRSRQAPSSPAANSGGCQWACANCFIACVVGYHLAQEKQIPN